MQLNKEIKTASKNYENKFCTNLLKKEAAICISILFLCYTQKRNSIDLTDLILMVCQLIWGYFMPRG